MRELVTIKEELLHTFSLLDLTYVISLIFISNAKSILKCRYVQQKKLINLIPGSKPETSLDSHGPKKAISNFSSHTLSDFERSTM